MIKISVNKKRAEIIFNRLIKAYRDKEYPYNLPKAHPPQVPENLPKNLKLGGVEHALFLFCLCYYMRGGIDSETAIKALAKLHEAHPDIFDLVMCQIYSISTIAEFLKKFGLGFNCIEIATYWIHNFKFLCDYWDNNPMNLFKRINSFEQACKRIRNKNDKKKNKHSGFWGFQFKMVSMLAYFYAYWNLIDPFDFPPPVDFHILRIMFINRILIIEEKNGGDIYEAVTTVARPLLLDYCRKNGISPIELGDSMWFLSRLLCKWVPGNLSIVGKRNGRKTPIKPKKITWNRSQMNTHRRTCWSCPIRDTCEHHMPSSEYYIHGDIKIRERSESPQSYFDL